MTLPQVTIGYETWGTLNETGDNAILILHALTGDTHVSRGVPTPDMPAPLIRAIESDGWWEGIVGPGAVIDTNRYFVVAPNILGGCYGSTGPASIIPEGYPGAASTGDPDSRSSPSATRCVLRRVWPGPWASRASAT